MFGNHPTFSFDFILKTPPVSELIKKMIKLKSGSPTPNTKFVGKLSRKQVEEIANQKMEGLNAGSLDAACEIIKGKLNLNYLSYYYIDRTYFDSSLLHS